jgi:hypothetical protein
LPAKTASEAETVLSSEAIQQNAPEFRQALAVSASDDVSTQVRLQHPESFGLLGSLAGHRFYALRADKVVTIYIKAYDPYTIELYDGVIFQFFRIKNGTIISGNSHEERFSKAPQERVSLSVDSFSYTYEAGNLGFMYRMTERGDLALTVGENPVAYLWGTMDEQARRGMSIQSKSDRETLSEQIAHTQNDIAANCPNGAINEDCADTMIARNQMMEELGQAPPDRAGEEFVARRLQRLQEHNAEVVAASNDMLTQYTQAYAAGIATNQLRRSEPRSRSASSTDAYNGVATSPANIATASHGSAGQVFGSLPAGVGTPAQRQFWANKCEEQRNDGSPAAQGCEQTRSTIRAAPSVVAVKGAGGISTSSGSSNAGSSSNATDVPLLHAENCISTIGGARDSFRNRCGFTVIVAYCVENLASHPWACTRGSGAADTISPGGTMDGDAGLADENYKGVLKFRFVACRGGLGTLAVLHQQGTIGTCN